MASETPRGPVVESLMERGLAVSLRSIRNSSTAASSPSPTALPRRARLLFPEHLPGVVERARLMFLKPPSRHLQTTLTANRTSRLPNRTGAPTMPAGPSTGAQRRKLPTGHPSVADRRATSPFKVLNAQGPTPDSLPEPSRNKRQGEREGEELLGMDQYELVRTPSEPFNTFGQGTRRPAR